MVVWWCGGCGWWLGGSLGIRKVESFLFLKYLYTSLIVFINIYSEGVCVMCVIFFLSSSFHSSSSSSRVPPLSLC